MHTRIKSLLFATLLAVSLGATMTVHAAGNSARTS